MQPQSIGIIGHGDFGRFLEVLAQRYVPQLPVRIFSRSAVPDNVRFFGLEDTCRCQVVIIAVSIRDFEEALQEVLPLLSPDTILLEVNTIKTHPAKLLREQARCKYIATHPMFGPYSFKKQGETLAGLRFVITDHTIAEEDLDLIIRWLSAMGLKVVQMTPEAHDRMLADTLFLTHYIAQAVARGGFVRTDIDTLSFGYLMDAVESVKSDTELFKDVFRFNPFCEDTILRFEKAEWQVHDLLESE